MATRARQRRTGPAGGPRTPKGERARARLLDAAREVFERDGFLAARISDIASTAGLSQGSYYHYFDSKEQIFREVAAAAERRLTEPVAREHDGSIRAMIRADNRLYLERYADAARLMRVIEAVSRYDEQVAATRLATQRHFADQAEQLVRRAQARGVVDPRLDPVVTADALSAMVARFAELWLVQQYRDHDLDHVVDQLTTLCVNALGISEARATRPRRPPSTPDPGGTP